MDRLEEQLPDVLAGVGIRTGEGMRAFVEKRRPVFDRARGEPPPG